MAGLGRARRGEAGLGKGCNQRKAHHGGFCDGDSHHAVGRGMAGLGRAGQGKGYIANCYSCG